MPKIGAAAPQLNADSAFFSEDDQEAPSLQPDDSSLFDSPLPRERAPVEMPRKRKRQRVMPGNWSLGGRPGLVVAAVAGVVLLGLAMVSTAGAILLTFVGGATLLVGALWTIVTPFRESVVCGIMWLFVPFYALYYLISRWADMWRPFATYWAGWLIVVLSVVVNPALREEWKSDELAKQPRLAQGQIPGQEGFGASPQFGPGMGSPNPGQPNFGIPGNNPNIGSGNSPASPPKATTSAPRSEPPTPEGRRDQLVQDLASSNPTRRRDALLALATMKPDDNREVVARRIESTLHDFDKRAVENALDALAVWGDEQSVGPVRQLLRNTSWPSAKAKAMAILVKYPDESLVELVADVAADMKSNGEVRTILEQMGPLGESAAVKILADNKAWVFTRRDVAKYIESMSRKKTLAPDSVAQMLEVIRDDHDHDTARPLIAALATVKEERVADFLATGLDDFWYAKDAKSALIKMGPAAENAVAKYLKHQKPEVRFTCCEILAAIGTKKSVAALRSLVANNPVGQAAKSAIDAINQRAKFEN